MDDKKEHFKRYGWTCSEENLKTLPDTAPQGVKDLAKWLTLEGRRSSLQEYLNVVNRDDSRIHGKFWHIGAWTHRMSHSNPNQANIPAVFTDEPKTAIEEIKAKYDGQMRSLFTTEEGEWLIGCDADGIQLRVLAHYMNDTEFTKALESGDKSKGTDVHTLNMKKLGSVCRNRDTAKTFIYAWLLGAGIPKIASILGCSNKEAKNAVDNFIAGYPGLKKLKQIIIPRDAARGYFIGLDGRKVMCDSEHLMLAGYLQSGEAIIMKWAARDFHKRLNSTTVKMVDFVHDEFQVSCTGPLVTADIIGNSLAYCIVRAGEELGLRCKLAANYKVGRNWEETH